MSKIIKREEMFYVDCIGYDDNLILKLREQQ